MDTRSGLTRVHRFRSNILDMIVFRGRLIVSTERGIYMQDKNGKRWRKLAPAQSS